MKQRASRSFPTVRSLIGAVSLSGLFLLSGCGGGGGSNNNNNNNNNNGGGNNTLATITGKVVNASSTGVGGVSVSAGGRTTTTGNNGVFTLTNVPLATAGLTISPPAGYDRTYVSFQSKTYDTTKCPLPLPTLINGTVSLAANVSLYSDTTPPPPPPDSCP